MKTSNSIAKIAPALLTAQRAMTAAAKSATNPHFKSKYSDLATVIEAVKVPLNEAGITFLQACRNDTTGVMVETMLMHESGEWIAETIYLPVPQQTPQAYGSGITYAKRYGLQSLAGLPSEDDDGERASEPEKADAHRVEPKDPKWMSYDARQVAVDALEAMGPEERDFLRSIAKDVERLFAKGEDMVTYVEGQKLDTEEKLALWSLMPSNQRSAYKKQQAEKAKGNGKMLALGSQP